MAASQERSNVSNLATDAPIDVARSPDSAGQLLLGGMPPHPSLFRVRVTRAELSTILGCSKPTITRWAQAGRLVFAPDGRIDAAEAIRQILRTADPRVLRVGLFRQAMGEVAALRAEAARAAGLAAELTELREALAKMTAERDRLAAQIADLMQYADDAARRLAERGSTA